MAFPPNSLPYEFQRTFPEDFNQNFTHIPSHENEFQDPRLLYPSPPPQPQDFPNSQTHHFHAEPCFPSPPLSGYSPPAYQLPHQEQTVC